MAWTEERIAKLKAGWESGMTASQIAEMLGDVTRNAVIGKAHRLGLESRPSPVKGGDDAPAPAPAPVAAAPAPAPAAPAASAAAAPAPVVAAPPPAPAPVVARAPAPKPVKAGKGQRTTLLDLNEKVCKWPIGHPGEPDFHFCGKPANPGFPYCGEHCLVAYQAQMPRRDRGQQPPRLAPNMGANRR